MNQIIKKHWRFLAMAIVITTVSSLTAVFVQFEKGRVLDYALARQTPQALRSGAILLVLILLELATYYAYNIFSSKFFLNGVKSLREAFFTATLRRKYPDFRDKAQGEYLAMYTDQIDKMQKQYIETIIWMFEISIKALSVSIGLFVLDWRLALITLFLLTTPLYVPKLVSKNYKKPKKRARRSLKRISPNSPTGSTVLSSSKTPTSRIKSWANTAKASRKCSPPIIAGRF